MTSDQDELAKRVAEARLSLKRAMANFPFDFNTAGSTRISAWKMAHAQATGLLERAPSAVAPYSECELRIRSCGTASLEDLVKEMWK